jgi:chromosomal replication initiation ATPase DnaA
MEPCGLDRDAKPIADYRSVGSQIIDAQRGSDKLLNAILKMRGVARAPAIASRTVPHGRRTGCVKRRLRYAKIFRIQAEIAKRFGIAAIDIIGPRKTNSHARQLAMFLSREMTDASFPDIARHFNRDHSTIVHGYQQIQLRIESGCIETIEVINSVTEALAA